MRKSPSPLTKINCDFCGKEREIDNYALTKRKNHFCSKKCFTDFWHKTNSKSYSCACCGKIFERANAFTKNDSHKKYCSVQCRYVGKRGQATWSKGKKIGHNEKISGKKHWNWKGGVTGIYWSIRGSSLMDSWRLQVFQRDAFVCQSCFETGGKLNAHHKIRFMKLYSDFLKVYEKKKDLYIQLLSFHSFWDIKNGVTLCRKCHNKIHSLEGK